MERYSIIILTKNEGDIIEICIENIPQSIDCFVLDSGSTDDTKAKCLKCGIPFYEHQITPFLISEQRNWALENIPLKTDWVLFLDADEIVPLELHQEILSRIQDANYIAYRLAPKYMFWGKWLKRTQGYPNWHDRLLRKDKIRFTGGVWESFDSSDFEDKIAYIHIPYIHNANIKGFEAWLEKNDRYTSWDAREIFYYLTENRTFSTKNKVTLRALSAKYWKLLPWARFFYKYIFHLGFLEGWRAFYYCILWFISDYMIVIKIIELKRKSKGEEL